MITERINFFFISAVNWCRLIDEENGRPKSQPNETAAETEKASYHPGESSSFWTCYQLATDAIDDRKGKAFRRGANAIPNSSLCSALKPLYLAALRILLGDGLPCSLVHFDVRAHLLELRGLIFHHRREACNSAFQIRDPLLLIAGLVEHGLRRSHLIFQRRRRGSCLAFPDHQRRQRRAGGA